MIDSFYLPQGKVSRAESVAVGFVRYAHFADSSI
jgi:hypothetical protein|tara:strand:- start:48 stop:149 length:102 start_codon:yes stop_codon:yes gene_type:complete